MSNHNRVNRWLHSKFGPTVVNMEGYKIEVVNEVGKYAVIAMGLMLIAGTLFFSTLGRFMLDEQKKSEAAAVAREERDQKRHDELLREFRAAAYRTAPKENVSDGQMPFEKPKSQP